MALFEQMKKDKLEALKNKQVAKKDLLGCVIAEASKNVKEPDDATMISTIKKFIANAQELQANAATRSNSTVEINRAQYEIDVLNLYLPYQLSEQEIKVIVARFARPINLGDVQKHFKENYAGRYDGKLVSKIVKETAS